MRIFASERVAAMMKRLGMKPGEPIEHSLVTKAIENAQRKLEGHNFDIRKQLLDYDNVANDQRKVIYTQRAALMEMTDPGEYIQGMREEVISSLFDNYMPAQSLEEEWDIDALTQVLDSEFQIAAPVKDWIEADHSIQPEEVRERVIELASKHYEEKEAQVGREVMAQFEKSVILQTLDNQWREHLATMDHLRQGIHLRGYAQKDPKQEYKREAFNLFTSMLDSMKYDIIRLLSSVELQSAEDVDAVEEQRRSEKIVNMQYAHPQQMDGELDEDASQPYIRQGKKVGRNEPCPCGSGKKYKACHGKLV